MIKFYNKHYILVDTKNRVIDGWSDGPQRGRDTSNAICINEKGGYQFRLTPDGAENPPLFTYDGISLYRWNGQAVQPRTEAEITADRAAIPKPEPSKMEQLEARFAALEQQLTDTQIAVCETYELITGGNDNG